MWSVICGETTDESLVSKKASEYGEMFSFAKISGNDEYITQTFGQLMSSVKLASQVSIIIALLISILITFLFIKMLITKDRYSIAIMKSFGFTNSDIRTQYVSRSVFVLLIIICVLLTTIIGTSKAGEVEISENIRSGL